MSILVKICGLRSLEDALSAADSGADALGFNFWRGSPRYIEPAAARSIILRLPPGMLKVGVFVDETAEAAEAVSAEAGIDLLQLHGSAVAPGGRRWWQAISATEPRLREKMEISAAEAFLIDSPSETLRGGTGRTFDWSLVRELPRKVILAGGLAPENVAEAIRLARPLGVDACSRLESEPGKKDKARVAAFIRAARSAES
jgi:phosphoribosylanthranilate isomerase